MDDRIFKICPIKKKIIFKIHEVLFLFYNVHKEIMFTMEMEDGFEAP